jgi:iron-sulfur cluster assembly protein
MMTLTPTAAQAVRSLVNHLDVDMESGGLRIASGDDASLALTVVNGPESADERIDVDGAHVFMEPAAAELLGSKVLDAQVGDGGVQFVLFDAT